MAFEATCRQFAGGRWGLIALTGLRAIRTPLRGSWRRALQALNACFNFFVEMKWVRFGAVALVPGACLNRMRA